jgi:hypothetical protein
MTIQFPTSNAQNFNADAGAEKLKVSDVRFMSIEYLEWSLLGVVTVWTSLLWR